MSRESHFCKYKAELFSFSLYKTFTYLSYLLIAVYGFKMLWNLVCLLDYVCFCINVLFGSIIMVSSGGFIQCRPSLKV